MSIPASSGNNQNPLGKTPVQQGNIQSSSASANSVVPKAPAVPAVSTTSGATPVVPTAPIAPVKLGGDVDRPMQQPGNLEKLPPLPATLPVLGSENGKKYDQVEPLIEEKEEGESEEYELEDEPQVVERVIIKEKGGGLGCFGMIRRLTCFFLLIFLVLVAAVLALIIFKPPFLTEPIKIFLNGDYKPADVSQGITEETVEGFIDEVTSPDEGEVTFQLTEDQLTTLVRARLTDGADVRVGLEENKIQIFTDAAQQGEPLWVIVELTDTDDKLVFSRIGFGRINTPASAREFVKDKAFGFIGSVIKDLKLETSEQLVSSLVGGEIESGVTIKNVKFAQDLVLVTVEL